MKNDTFQCLKCKKLIITEDTSLSALRLHHVTHLPHAKIFRCLYCEFTTAKQTEISAHLKSMHHKEMQNTGECTDYRNPKRNGEFYLRFLCPLCKHLMNEFSTWLEHINNMHESTSTELNMRRIANSSNYCCLSCKRLLYTNDRAVLQRHRFTHLPFPDYFRCAFCTTAKKTKIEILRHCMHKHKRVYDMTQKFITKPIEWGESTKSSLNETTTCNFEEMENSKVTEPKKVSVDETSIDNHVHYRCPECGIEFRKSVEWRAHIFQTHNFEVNKNYFMVKPNYYQCLHCKQYLMCKRIGDLQRHQFSHKPYPCYLKCVHCGTFEKDKESMLCHLNYECSYKKLTKDTTPKLPDQLNLFLEPYDNEAILHHLQESNVHILKMAQEYSIFDSSV